MGVLRPRFLIYLFVYLLCLELPGRRGGCVIERPPRPRPRTPSPRVLARRRRRRGESRPLFIYLFIYLFICFA